MGDDTRVRRWLEPVALFGLPFLLYLGSLDYGLIGYDDSRYYLVNPALRDGARGLVGIFTSAFFSDYMPVTQLSWWLDVTLFGDEHFAGARLHGLAWFGAATLGVRALVARITGRPGVALAVALLFAVHPIASHSILWLAQRKNLVALAFALWSGERYVAARTAQSARAARARGAAALAFAAMALLAKAHAATLPALLAACEAALQRGGWRERLVAIAPFTLLAGAFVAFNLWGLRADLAGEPLAGGRLPALLASGPIVLRYLEHTLAPIGLSFLYAVNEEAGAAAWAAWAAVLAAAVLSVAVASERRMVAWGWLFGLAGLLPALNLVAQPQPMADQYNLWALPGWLCAGVLLAHQALVRLDRRAPAVACALVATLFALQSARRTPEYAWPQVLFAAAVLHQPESGLAWSEHARVLLRGREETDRARGRAAARTALSRSDAHRILAPDRAVLAQEAALSLFEAGEAERAHAFLEAELAGLAPEFAPVAEVARAEFAIRSGDPGAAVALLAPHIQGIPVRAFEALREHCRAGRVLPDQLAPVVGLSLGAADAADLDFGRRVVMRRLELIALARAEAGELEAAFDAAALLVNTAPDYEPGRAALASIYRRLGLRGAAEALLAARRPAEGAGITAPR